MAGRRPLKNDKHTAFYYAFTPKEMKYFLFGKKICPRCGGKLIRHKTYETIYGSMPFKDHADRIDPRKVKHHIYFYSCDHCRVTFSLAELAGEQ